MNYTENTLPKTAISLHNAPTAVNYDAAIKSLRNPDTNNSPTQTNGQVKPLIDAPLEYTSTGFVERTYPTTNKSDRPTEPAQRRMSSLPTIPNNSNRPVYMQTNKWSILKPWTWFRK